MKSLQTALLGLSPCLPKSCPSLLLLLWFFFTVKDAAAWFVGAGFHPGTAERHCECLGKGLTVELLFVVHRSDF